MSTEERVQLVRLLAERLGDNDITDRHVQLDRVDKRMLLHAAEGCISELDLNMVGAVAMGAIDCRLVFLTKEINEETDGLLNRGFAIYVDCVE